MSEPASAKRPTEAWRSEALFQRGMGQVVVARFKSNGDAELGMFLVDSFYFGVKNAHFARVNAVEYDDVLERIFPPSDPRIGLSPSCARKLVEDAVAFAGRLGVVPHEDYKKGCRVFGGIDASTCGERFEFGHDGSPLMISGPPE